jgi:hypothetical protein
MQAACRVILVSGAPPDRFIFPFRRGRLGTIDDSRTAHQQQPGLALPTRTRQTPSSRSAASSEGLHRRRRRVHGQLPPPVQCQARHGPDADRVFDGMPTRDSITWNSTVNGSAINGHGALALDCLQHGNVRAARQSTRHVLQVCYNYFCGKHFCNDAF